MVTKCPNCNHTFDTSTANDAITEMVKKHMDDCINKFRENNPCPKCGSHNVDTDLGTPMWCNDCGWGWEG